MTLVVLDTREIERDALMERARRAATGLAALGVREGGCIALLLRNDFAFLEASQAAAMLGAYVVPINWHGQSAEVRYVLDDCAPQVLIAHAELLAGVRNVLLDGLAVISVATPPESWSHYGMAVDRGVSAGRVADELAAVDVVAESHRVGSSDPAATPAFPEWDAWLAQFDAWTQPPPASRSTMIYTSGTTGRPKGVRRQPARPEQTVAIAAMFRHVYGVRPGARSLVAGPLYHSSPNAFMRQALAQGEVFVMQSRFDPERTLATIERYRITHAVMVPTMFVRLLKLPREVRERYDVRSLEWVTHTAAPCPVEVKKALIDWWGPVVVETYGSTEMGTATVCTSSDWLAHPGSVGRPTPGTRFAFYDEQDRVVPEGGIGEIFARVPCYADFTYHNHDAKRCEIERDGLISCGDVGYMKDGFLYLCDRRADMVISGGVNIYPAEIESALVQAEQVRDCAVFGIPDEDLGEVLMAAIELAPGVSMTSDEVAAFLAPSLAKYKIPKRIEFHAALPREDSGKIFKRRLRDPHWEQAGRKI